MATTRPRYWLSRQVEWVQSGRHSSSLQPLTHGQLSRQRQLSQNNNINHKTQHTLNVCSSRWTGAELSALTTAMTPLKLFSS